MTLLILAMLAILGASPSTAFGQEIADRITAVLERAEGALSEGFAGSMPLPAASAGVSYSFDPATANFQREPATFGQIYLDRADPLGKRRFNFSFAYQYAQLDKLEGHDADNLRDPYPFPLEGLLGAIQIPTLDIDAAVHSFLFGASYGVTDNLDVSIAVPVLYSDVHLETEFVGAAITPDGELLTFADRLEESNTYSGVGDVVLRAKYRLLEQRTIHASSGLLLRLPSGDESHLHGTGYVEVAPSLFVSTRIFEPARWARLQGHFNTSVGFNTDDVDSSEARWGVGLDWGLSESVTAAVAFLARHPFARIGDAGSFEFTRCNTDVITCASDPSVRTARAPIFGLTGERNDSFAASIGGRGALWRDTVFLLLNVAVPLNNAFVRPEPIPLIGVEATF